MTFSPQYNSWAIDDFTSNEGAVYLNPGDYEINNGVISLLPILFSGQYYSFNSPWDPIGSWDIESNLDSIPIVTGQFSIVSTTGYLSSYTGSYGNSGDTNQTAFFTSTITPALSGVVWVSGAHATFVRNAASTSSTNFQHLTIECSVRSLGSGVTHGLYAAPSSGLSCHGIYFGDQAGAGFVEVHPSGLKIHGVTGGILPGDYTSSMRRIRVVKDFTSVTLMSDDGSSIYVGNAIKPQSTASRYIAVGAPPGLSGNGTFTGTSGWFHNNPFRDINGLTGIGGYEGTVLWDDIKIKYNQATTTYGNGYSSTWPSGSRSLYTAPWYPGHHVYNYSAVTVNSKQYPGGTVSILPQYKAPSGLSGETAWVDSTQVSPLVITASGSAQAFLDISSLPIYQGIDNALRFKVTATSSGIGPGPQIDSITVIGKSPYQLVDVVPNWKLSALPKDVLFAVNHDHYNAMVPPPHFEDEIYLYTTTGLSVPLSGYVPSPEVNFASGQVISLDSDLGVTSVSDGVYGPAVRNFVTFSGYTGVWRTNTYSNIDTGIFHGNLLDCYSNYPTVAATPSFATGTASVNYSVNQYTDLDGNLVNAQTVAVQNYVHSTDQRIVGFNLTNIVGPQVAGMIGVFEGTIQIEKGPGVMVAIKDKVQFRSYYLDGSLYRQPRKFSCAILYETSDAANATIALGVLPRTSQPSGLNLDDWGDWANAVSYHDTDQFTVYNLTGYIAKHSYLQYTCTGSVSRTSPLDPLPIYNSVNLSPLRRDAVVFEGWVRPIGLRSGLRNETLLFESLGADARGTKVYIDRTGQIRANIDFNIHNSALGYTGAGITPLGANNFGVLNPFSTGAVNLVSESAAIAWGDWNHIGVYQDVRTLGDTYTTTDQPVLASTGLYNGARSAKLYLELNGRVVNSYDLAVDSYTGNIVTANSISPGYPATDVSVPCWPHVPIYATSGSARTAKLGEFVIGDFDHVRFGVRTHVDAKTLSTVYGSKKTPPTFVPWNALKVPEPISGGREHYQWAHIYRFDHPTAYQLWDDGYSINHGIAVNYFNRTEVVCRGIKSSTFFVRRTDGPKGRDAIRLGPGSNIKIPFSAYDERLFNGTGSCSLIQATASVNSGMYYVDNASYNHSNMYTWVTGRPDFPLYSSNSHFVAGGKFRLHKYPTSKIGDLFSYEEAFSTQTNSSYGLGDLYVGVNTTGSIVYGTRRNSSLYGISDQWVVGPFTGDSVIPLETWIPIGIDANMASGNGWMRVYTGDVIASNTSLVLSHTGALSPTSGRPLGYQGLLGGQTSNPSFRSNFIIGGEQAHNAGISYTFMDMDVSEFFIGYPLSGYTWPWSTVAYTGSDMLLGHADVSIKNLDTVIAPVVGTGIGSSAFYNGVTRYPATSYSDAGEHLFWSTSNGGNDYEGKRGFGVRLYDPTTFINAESYYVIYENDSATDVLGSVDSPIQIGIKVPPEGVNLALISDKEWTSDSVLTTFDLSDRDYANITNKLRGDFTIKDFTVYPNSGIYATGRITADDIRVSSIPLWNDNSPNTAVGYFAHLIGGDYKGVYLPNAFDHNVTTSNGLLYHLNIGKVEQAILIKDSDGNTLSFDEFPYRVITSPYPPSATLSSVRNSLLGWSGSLDTGQVNPNQMFTCTLVAENQSIGKTVFIHYPSRSYTDGTINLQDSEIYNPIPVMKQVDYEDTIGPNNNVLAPTGSFSLQLSDEFKKYNIVIWGVDLTGWTI